MRKIFNELPPTPEPEPCSAAKEAFEKAKSTLNTKLNKLTAAENIFNANLESIKLMEDQKNPNKESIKTEQANYESVAALRRRLENESGTGNKNENGVPSAECYTPSGGLGRYRNSARCVALLANIDILYKIGIEIQAKIETYNLQIDKIDNQINAKKNLGVIFEKNKIDASEDVDTQKIATNLAEAAYNECVKKTFSQKFNLKLNLSCKQIKQKIKIVNQKRISINRKSLDLNYGANSLDILNINKKLSDEIIEISQELMLKLDKIKPPIINIDPSFSDIYKKAKDDLSSYQTEGKILEAKLKKLKIKEKTIPIKKNKLKTKFYKLIKQLKTC